MARDERYRPENEIPELVVAVSPKRVVEQGAKGPEPKAGEPAPKAVSKPPEAQPAATAATAASLGSQRQAASAGFLDDFGSAFEDDMLGNDMALEVAAGDHRAAMRSEDAESSLVAWPSGCDTPAAELEVPEEAIRQQRPWGDAPRSLLHCPGYAWSVFQGERRLDAAVAAIDAELEVARRRRDELLGELARTKRSWLEMDESCRSALEPLRSAETLFMDASRHLNSASDSYAEQFATLSRELAEAQASVVETEQSLPSLRGQLEQAETDARREQARRQRLQIEARAVEQSAANLPDAQEQLTRLSARAAELDPLIAETEARAAACRSGLAEKNVERDHRLQKSRQIEQHQRELDRQRSTQLSTASSSVKAAESAVRQARAETGRAILAGQGRIPVEAAELEAIRDADQRVRGVLLRRELLVRARGHRDENALRRGQLIILTGCALLVLLVVLRLVH